MKPTKIHEPLRHWFPELNSLQIAKLRQMINEAKIEEFDKLMVEYGSRGVPSYPPYWELYVEGRIKELKQQMGVRG